MNLREIIAITGKPGLYRIVSNGNRMFIVENIADNKRMPVGQRDKVVSLGDIAMYTDAEDLPLGVILDRLYERHEGKALDVKGLMAEGKLAETFAEVVPDFDRDRVYPTDIKKLFTWYNLLAAAGLKDFAECYGEPEAEPETEAEA